MNLKHIKTPIKGLNLYLNKVISDERGSYCDMAPGGTENELYSDGIKHIHASIATKKFIPRGGHYHYKLRENFFTLSGTALWYFYDFNQNSPTYGESYSVILGHDKLGINVGIQEFTIYNNSAAQIAISPGVYHVFWPLTDMETVVAGTGSTEYDSEDYNRMEIKDVPGAIEIFEKIKKKITEYGKNKIPDFISPVGQKSLPLNKSENKLMKKIKAIIPAAKNNQQRPFSHTINKHLIPLGGRPMIFHPIENLAESGIDQLGIIIGREDDVLKQVVGDGSRWGIKIEYIIQQELTGLGSAIISARDFINNEPFILYLGDNIINYSIADLVNKYFKEKLNALLLLAKVNCPQRFGVPEIVGGNIVRVEERPMRPKSDFAVAGFYIYDENAFKAMDAIKLSDRGQYEISDIHNYYINSDLKLDYQEISKWWKDRGKPEDLLEGNKFVLQNCVFAKKQEYMEGEIVGNAKVEGSVKVGKGTRIVGKTLIRGPVSIGEGCLIKDSYVGPWTSIGNASELNSVEIEYSLIMDNVNIYTKEKIVNSVIGRNASIVSGDDNLPRGKKVIIGENSVVGW
ncbi:MAG: glucose-1-phosphate thymidylyltransferase [Candidatus Pacebacteria bacterium]|nr:glucose-1-phosphate thymidylyltransferase [Candidatus Paceibacterota bacterium]